MTAIYQNTDPNPSSPWVMPGVYTVKLTVNGTTYSQPLTVKMDPRAKTPVKDLQLQHDLALDLYDLRKKLRASVAQTDELKAEKAKTERAISSVYEVLQDADLAPTQQAIKAAGDIHITAIKLISTLNAK